MNRHTYIQVLGNCNYSLCFNRHIGLVGRVIANLQGKRCSISGRVMPKTLKMILDTSLLNTPNIRYVSRVNWSNPGKGIAPSPRCSSYWKRSLLVALDYCRQLYFYLCSTYVIYYEFSHVGFRMFSVNVRFCIWNLCWITHLRGKIRYINQWNKQRKL